MGRGFFVVVIIVVITWFMNALLLVGPTNMLLFINQVAF